MWGLYWKHWIEYWITFCRTTAKEKKPSWSRHIPRAYGSAALRKSEPPFLFAFPTMLMQSGGRYIGGYRHVNFRHSQHPWAAPIKKSLAPPPGRYDFLSALSFHLNQQNSRCFCRASFPLRGAGVFYCRFFRKAPEVCRCRSPPPFDSLVNRPWIEMEVHNEESQSSGSVSRCL